MSYYTRLSRWHYAIHPGLHPETLGCRIHILKSYSFSMIFLNSCTYCRRYLARANLSCCDSTYLWIEGSDSVLHVPALSAITSRLSSLDQPLPRSGGARIASTLFSSTACFTPHCHPACFLGVWITSRLSHSEPRPFFLGAINRRGSARVRSAYVCVDYVCSLERRVRSLMEHTVDASSVCENVLPTFQAIARYKCIRRVSYRVC